MHYLIDGYNYLFRLLHRGESVQGIRIEFIQSLSYKVNLLGLNATLVFDSKYQPGEHTRKKEGFLEIVYTNEGETADEWILEELKNTSNIRLETVVTSDKKLEKFCLIEGSHSLSCEAFRDFLNKKVRSFPKKEKPLKPLPKKAPETVIILPPKNLADSFDYYLNQFDKGEDQPTPAPPKTDKKVSKTKREKKSLESEMDRWTRLFGA